jgi:fluoroquinolone resistance protein
MDFIQDESYSGLDYSQKRFKLGEYEECRFNNCRFVESDLTACEFVSCTFIDCDLSNAKLDKVALKDVHFLRCKMLGLKFERTNPFLRAFDFATCVLNYASFYQMPVKETAFRHCALQDVDFAGSDLQKAQFIDCNLKGAIFENTDLRNADFSTSQNIEFNPDHNRVSGMKISLSELPGLMARYGLIIKR